MAKYQSGPKQYKDGFYIEVCDNKHSSHGIKIRAISKSEMINNAISYERSKHIIIWGEHKDGKWLSEKSVHSSAS